jgi:predicted nuclease of predicted toxin-antitoxin system
LPAGNRSTDAELSEIADEQDRIVVTKDRDFRDGYLLRNTPQKLLLVETGNVSNDDLLALFDKNANEIVAALTDSPFVELGFDRLVLHDPRSL